MDVASHTDETRNIGLFFLLSHTNWGQIAYLDREQGNSKKTGLYQVGAKNNGLFAKDLRDNARMYEKTPVAGYFIGSPLANTWRISLPIDSSVNRKFQRKDLRRVVLVFEYSALTINK